ncbi:MAG: DUF3857 domain-containing protein [Bacteroidales bacterium]|nr:DUF3857 domain-containing protein [Bacteroidales bacterium]
MKKFILTLTFILIFQHIFFSQINDAEIIKYNTKYSVSLNNILTEYVSVVIQINNRAGEDLTKIVIPFSEKSPLLNLNAGIEDISGNIVRKLKKKEVETKSYISNSLFYKDDYIKTFTLKHNAYPYRISYNYKKIHHNFFTITNWNPVIEFETPTKDSDLELIIPNNYKILINQKNISEPIIDSVEQEIKYAWSCKCNNNFKFNIFSPKKNEQIPYVKIAPINFKYSISGNQESWNNFGNWVYQLNEGLDILPEDEKNKIDELLKDKLKTKDKINSLYKYLQENTRYINVSIDIGGYKPYPALYVSTNKYGDCKALTNYMKSLLSYAGIKSYYSLIYRGDNYKRIDKDFTTSQFNHAILFIPGEKDTTWLECTSKYFPAGYLGTSTQGRYALIIDKDNSKLIKTHELSINDVEENRTIYFQFNNDGTGDVDLNFHLKGDEYEYFNSFSKTLNKDQKDKYIHRLIPFKNYDIKEWVIKTDSSNNASISFNACLNLKNYIKTYDDLKYISLFPSKIPSFEKPDKRIRDIRINYPINIKDSLIYKVIKGYKYKSFKDTSIVVKYGSYEIRSKIESDKIIVNKQFILFPNEYKLSEYDSFYEFIKSVKNIERKSPIVYIKIQ